MTLDKATARDRVRDGLRTRLEHFLSNKRTFISSDLINDGTISLLRQTAEWPDEASAWEQALNLVNDVLSYKKRQLSVAYNVDTGKVKHQDKKLVLFTPLATHKDLPGPSYVFVPYIVKRHNIPDYLAKKTHEAKQADPEPVAEPEEASETPQTVPAGNFEVDYTRDTVEVPVTLLRDLYWITEELCPMPTNIAQLEWLLETRATARALLNPPT